MAKNTTLLCSTLLIALALFCCASYSAGFAAIGIDFGTESFKVGMIQSTGIDLILNAQSGRKTLNSVGFDEKGERAFADAAARISARSPERIVYAAQRLLGRPLSHPVVELQQKRYHFKLEESKRGTVEIVIDRNNTFLPEEIVGMILETVQSMATNRLNSAIKDVVITVPPMFTEYERQGLLDGIRLAGLNPLALINEGSAVAQQWALSRDIPEEELNIVFYDFGAGTLKATLAGFRTVNESIPPSTKTKPVPQIIIKAVAWDETVGGIDFDLCLADYIADVVNKKRPGTPDIRESTRAMVKINKVARTIKEILSANQAYLLSIEGLIGDYDFSTTITRQEFEQACAPVFEKILSPLERVIAEANLTIADIHGVEAIGGSIRIPKVQEIIKNYLGRELDHHLNGDEAAVFGATFYSAVLSPGFKVQTEYRLKDIIQYEVGLKIESTDKDALAEGEEGLHQDILFRKGKRLTSKRTVSFRMSTNFTVDLHYTENDAPANTPSAIKQFTFTNVPSNVVNMTERPKISLTFQLNRNGLVELVRAEAEVGVMSWEERLVNKTTVDSKKDSDKAESKTSSEETKETEDAPKTEATDATAENNTKAELDYEIVGELVKKTRKFNLRYTTTYPSIKALSDEEYRSAQAKLRHWNRKDQARRDREEARNNLESYIYSTKERLYDDDFISASTEEERESLSTKLNEFGDWIYEDGEEAEASEYRKKLKEVKDIGDAVQFRLDEVTKRPEAAQFLRKSIEVFRAMLSNLTVTHNLTQTDLVDALEQSTDDEEWINAKEKEQETKSITDKPAFTSNDAITRGNNLKTTISMLMRRPKKKPPPPPKKSPTKKASSSSTKDATNEDTTTQPEETPESQQQQQTEEQQQQQQQEAEQQQQQEQQQQETTQTDEQNEKIQEELQNDAENVQL